MKLSEFIANLQETAAHIEDVEVVCHNSMRGFPCPLELMFINDEKQLELAFEE